MDVVGVQHSNTSLRATTLTTRAQLIYVIHSDMMECIGHPTTFLNRVAFVRYYGGCNRPEIVAPIFGFGMRPSYFGCFFNWTSVHVLIR